MPNNTHFDKRPHQVYICVLALGTPKNPLSMSHLTIEKMDRINFLITEVSLECLGNKFFDIYGKQTNSLLGLISLNSLSATNGTSSDSESDLWSSLTTERKSTNNNWTRPNKQRIVNKSAQGRKRRASISTTNNETDDPESLLVPMPSAPKAAKISNRRSTIAVQVAKNRKSPATAQPTATNQHRKLTKSAQSTNSRQQLVNNRKLAESAGPSNKAGKQIQGQPVTIDLEPFNIKQYDAANIAEIKKNLRMDVNIRKLFSYFFFYSSSL